MAKPTIFTFWEPRGSMTPYLQLCLQTWRQRLPQYPLVVLDHSNLADWFDPRLFDLAALKTLPLQVQKEAMMVGALKDRGGIFMDADTLAFRDIAPILRELDRSEVVIFNYHLAFMAARPGAELLALWAPRIAERLQRAHKVRRPVPWDYLGNAVLWELLEEKTASLASVARRRLGARMRDLALQAAMQLTGLGGRASMRVHTRLNDWRIGPSYVRHDFFRRTQPAFLGKLDRLKLGYIAEAVHFEKLGRSAPARCYQRFWFEEPLPLACASARHPMLVGLHNSWTPDWFRQLSEAQVLRHPCLLGRTLRSLLEV